MIISNRKTYLWMLAFMIAFSVFLSDTSVTMAQEEIESPVESISGADINADAEQSLDFEVEPDTVSTADEFKEWLDAHKNYGGRVKLTGNIILREFYYFTPGGSNRPDIIVDTDGYTIMAGGKISFISDGHLIFRGKAGSQGIFRAMKGSLLTLDGVIVEDDASMSAGQYVIWQEEGAGLVIAGTYVESQIAGNIHYADTPFVTESDKVCVIVEKGQMADNLLPAQIKGTVNFKGQMQRNQLVPVSWELKGTEAQQEKRLRFQVKGFSSEVTYDVAPVCTVVYHDYPLTFTNVDAYIQAKEYCFQGGYTKPKAELPMMVSSEYSFDGTNWVTDKEEMAAAEDSGFLISFPCSQWDTDQYPYLYIRLRGQKDDKRYHSNVLRYAAYSMGEAEDLGDSQSNDDSMVNPPENPKEDVTDKPSDQQPSENQKPSDDRKPSENQRPSDDNKSSDKDFGEHESGNRDIDTSDGNQFSNMEVLNEPADIPDNPATAEPIAEPTGGHDNGNPISGSNPISDSNPMGNINSHTSNMEHHNTEGNSSPSVDETDVDAVQTETTTMGVMSKELASAAQDETDGESGSYRPMTVRQKIDTTRNMVLISGLITLSTGVGVVAYFVHIGRKRRGKRRRTGSSSKASSKSGRKKVK